MIFNRAGLFSECSYCVSGGGFISKVSELVQQKTGLEKADFAVLNVSLALRAASLKAQINAPTSIWRKWD